MIDTNNRYVASFALAPLAGSIFQPTGFPDLGAATFDRAAAEGTSLLVESVQSMANHLEATTWDPATDEPVAELAAIPYVRVVDPSGQFLSSSRVDAHRLASPYVLDGTVDGEPLRTRLPEAFGLVSGRPLNNRAVAAEVFRLDPLSLLHGVFFAQKWAWQPKIARALTMVIEADDARPVVSGGVKRDAVTNESFEGQSAAEGYGMVPHHRTEYTAASITLHCVLDRAQLRSYGLSGPATELLEAIAFFEIATLLEDGLRLRTACDLAVIAGGDAPPARSESQARLAAAIDAAQADLAPVTTVVWQSKSSGKKTKGA